MMELILSFHLKKIKLATFLNLRNLHCREVIASAQLKKINYKITKINMSFEKM